MLSDSPYPNGSGSFRLQNRHGIFHSPHPPDHSGDHDDRDEVPAAVVVAGKSGSMAADHCSGGLLRMDLPEAVLEPV